MRKRIPDALERERLRKAAWSKANPKKAKIVANKKLETPARGPEMVTEIALSSLDMTLTKAVRDSLNEGVIDEYARTEDEWSEKEPIDVYAGGNKFFGADGGHRFAAKIKNGKKKIKCRVVQCNTEQEAFTLARLHAFRANSGHGLQRSPADKRKTIASCIAVPEHANLSDREIAAICKVGHWIVGDVRKALTANQQLTGEAASTNRKSTNPLGQAKPPSDSAPTSERQKKRLESGRATTPEPDPEDDDRPPPASPAAQPVPGKAADAVLDRRGRPIPACLVPLFRFGAAFVSDLRATHGECLEGIRAAADEPWGKGFPALLQTLEVDYKKIAQDVASAVPFCVCPHFDAAGTHPLGGTCKVCVNNRGWLSRHNWHQLSDPIKKLIDEMAVEKVTDAA